jgi:hypothetical protein
MIIVDLQGLLARDSGPGRPTSFAWLRDKLFEMGCRGLLGLTPLAFFLSIGQLHLDNLVARFFHNALRFFLNIPLPVVPSEALFSGLAFLDVLLRPHHFRVNPPRRRDVSRLPRAPSNRTEKQIDIPLQRVVLQPGRGKAGLILDIVELDPMYNNSAAFSKTLGLIGYIAAKSFQIAVGSCLTHSRIPASRG